MCCSSLACFNPISNCFQGSDGGEVVLAVQECVNTVATAYRGISGETATIVEALILKNITDVSRCTLVTVIYAN